MFIEQNQISDWYKNSFGKDYLKIYAHRDENEAREQVDFLEDVLTPEAGESILDLGCGTGRHSIELAKRGYRVVGLDLSAYFLSIARRSSLKDGVHVHFLRGDMRYLPFCDRFDVICNFFTSFGYFMRDADNLKVLKTIYDALKPRGRFLIDYINKTETIRRLTAKDQKEYDDVKIVQERSFDPINQRINKKIVITHNEHRKVYYESIRAYSPLEIEDMIQSVGLSLTEKFGTYTRCNYRDDSPRLIIIGRKK